MADTLRVAKVTDRVKSNRAQSKLSFGRFRKGLLRVYGFNIDEMGRFPKNYWHDQYDAWIRGDRSASIHDNTIKAVEWAEQHTLNEEY